jgi:hypothetical protein
LSSREHSQFGFSCFTESGETLDDLTGTAPGPPIGNLRWLIRQRSLWVALLLWTFLSVAFIALCHGPRGAVPLNLPPNQLKLTPLAQVIGGWLALIFLVLECGLVFLLTRRRPWPDLAQRAPQRAVALRETMAMLIYAVVVLLAGRWIGFHTFGEGIAMHLNGSLIGATRIQSPHEVYLWTAYDFTFFALLPYVVFRMRGYSREQLNLRSANWKNDTLVILVVLAIGCVMDFRGPNILQLTPHQQIVGGLLSFVIHLFLTDLPVMIFIYAILLPRYACLFSPATAFLAGAASYPAIHIFETFTRYDSPYHSLISAIFVFLIFFPPGVMKSFLTMRTGNAWIHMWGFHAISPHVTVDTRLIVHDFRIR